MCMLHNSFLEGRGGHHLTAANTTKGGGGGHFRLIQGYMHMSLVILNTLTFITIYKLGGGDPMTPFSPERWGAPFAPPDTHVCGWYSYQLLFQVWLLGGGGGGWPTT